MYALQNRKVECGHLMHNVELCKTWKKVHKSGRILDDSFFNIF